MEIDPNDRLLPPEEPASPRQRWRLKLDRPVRRVLPRSLLGRSLLILLIPLLVTQAISLELFYGSHLDVVSRRLTGAVAGEISETLLLLERTRRESERRWIIDSAAAQFQLGLTLRPHEKLLHVGSTNVLGPMDEDLAAALQQSIHRPLSIDWLSDPHTVKIQIQLTDGVLEVDAPRKRLDVGPIWLFVVWVAGSALLLFLVAALFMRNQVRAIRRLARAAEAFGMGRDPGPVSYTHLTLPTKA